MRKSFWQKDSLITHILFELQPIIIYSPVANFGDQSLLQSTHEIIHGNREGVTEKIRNALEHIRLKNFEPPYISFYCKEYVQPELQINDLWRGGLWSF